MVTVFAVVQKDAKKVIDVLGIAIVLFVIAIAMLFWGFSGGNEFTYDDERKEGDE